MIVSKELRAKKKGIYVKKNWQLAGKFTILVWQMPVVKAKSTNNLMRVIESSEKTGFYKLIRP